MRFRNEQQAPVQFTAGKVPYMVAPGGDLDLPDRLAYVVPRRGLALRCLEPDRLASLLQAEKPKPPKPEDDERQPITENDEGEAVAGTPWGGPDGPGPAEVTEAVESTLRQLEAQGVEVPGAKRRRRGKKAEE